MRKQLLIIYSLVFLNYSLFGQLVKPSLESFNLGWGWFNLRLTGNTVVPKFVDWQVKDKIRDKIIFQTSCDNTTCPLSCPGEFFADQKDVREKLIIGCKDANFFEAKVRYSDGVQWSPWSEILNIATPEEPKYSSKEINILVWGNELVSYGDICGINTKSRLGYFPDSTKDNFCYALQCDLRRVLNQKINVINVGGPDETIDSWLKNHKSKYESIYANGYQLSLFFFGHESARANITHQDFAKKLDSLSRYLASIKHHHIINSIHYTINTNKATRKQQTDYLAAWLNKINTLEALDPDVEPYLWKGLDLYNMFRTDSLRFVSLDGEHLDMSEGIPGLVYRLAPLVMEVMRGISTEVEISTTSDNKAWINGNRIICNLDDNSFTHYNLTDIMGRVLQTGKLEANDHVEIMIKDKIESGIIILDLGRPNKNSLQTKLFYNK